MDSEWGVKQFDVTTVYILSTLSSCIVTFRSLGFVAIFNFRCKLKKKIGFKLQLQMAAPRN